jgi:hypothetical protein
MKEEVAKKLVEAARSGRYEQTRGCLKSSPKVVELGVIVGEKQSCFCILGILCDLFAHEHPLARWEQKTFCALPGPEMIFAVDVKPDNSCASGTYKTETHLPALVVDWAGLQSQDGMFEITNDMEEDLPRRVGKTESLMNLNDDHHWDFHRIADFVEKYWMHI